MPDPAEPAEDPPSPGAGLSRSALLAGAGLLLLGVSASVFLVVSARMVGPDAFTGIAVLWTLVYTVGIGVFVPFEHELSRAMSVRASRGEDCGRLVRRSAQLAVLAYLATVALTLLAMAVPATRSLLFTDSGWYAAALLVAVGGLAWQYLQRGVFAASGDFTAYGVQQGVEGAVRIVACAAAALLGLTDPRVYAAVLALAPYVPAVLLQPRCTARVGRPGPAAPVAELRGRFGWLLLASTGSQSLANLAAPAVRALAGPAQAAAAGNFLSALTIARVPLLLYAAVQAALVPRLARAREAADWDDFGRALRTVLLATGAVGLAGVAGIALLGPEVLGLLFGPDFGLPRGDLVLLACSAASLMLCQALHSTVVALDDHRWTGLSWAAGVAGLLAFLLVPLPAILRVELALLVGSGVVIAALWVRVARRPRSTAQADRRR